MLLLFVVPGCSNAIMDNPTMSQSNFASEQLLQKTDYVEVSSRSFHGTFDRDDAMLNWVRQLLMCVEEVEQLSTTYKMPVGHKIAAEHQISLFSSNKLDAPICRILHYEHEAILEVVLENKIGYRVPLSLNEKMGNLWAQMRERSNRDAIDVKE